MLGFGALGQYALGQILPSNSIQFITATGTFLFAVPSIALNVNAPQSLRAYNLTGIATPFSVNTNEAVGGFALTGISTTFKAIQSPSVTAPYVLILNDATLNSTSAALGFGPFALTGSSTTPFEFLTKGNFTLNGQATPFATSWTGLGAGAYNLTLYKSKLPEQWGGRPGPSGLWTAKVNDTIQTTMGNAQFGFAALGTLALGQGFYSPTINSEGWKPITKTSTWTPINSDTGT